MTYTFGLDTFGDRYGDADGKPLSHAQTIRNVVEEGVFAEQAGVRNLVLTHFSPRYQENGALPLSSLEDEARAQYGGHLVMARDLDHYVLDREGSLRLAVA